MTSLQIRNESDRARVLGHIAGMDIAKPKKLAITEVDRSGEQNKALHAALATQQPKRPVHTPLTATTTSTCQRHPSSTRSGRTT